MASILSNTDAEALLLDIRTARAAERQAIDDTVGAFLVFPTSVVITRPGRGQLVYPLATDIEPGTIVQTDGGSEVSATVDGISVSGRFSWRLAHERAGEVAPAVASATSGEVAPADYRFRRRGRDVAPPEWAAQLPASRCLPADSALSLGRQRRRLLRQGRAAEYWLLNLTGRIVRQSCRGPMRRALNGRPPVDIDDVVQRGMQVVCRLLPTYASPERPPCSWLGLLRLDSTRDMHREISRLDWVPPEAAAVLALAHATGVRPESATLTSLAEAAEQAGLAMPRVGPQQVRAALTARSMTALELLAPAVLDSAVARMAPELEAAGERSGRVAAEVARLVSDDPQLVALAGLGDDRALGKVGSKVVAALGTSRETAAATRRRCWADFQDSGQMFDTAAARRRFRRATADSLAAIDESLREAAGIGGRAEGAGGGSAGTW